MQWLHGANGDRCKLDVHFYPQSTDVSSLLRRQELIAEKRYNILHSETRTKDDSNCRFSVMHLYRRKHTWGPYRFFFFFVDECATKHLFLNARFVLAGVIKITEISQDKRRTEWFFFNRGFRELIKLMLNDDGHFDFTQHYSYLRFNTLRYI